MHQYIIDVPVLGKVFTDSKYRNCKTKPCYLQTKYHNKNDIDCGNKASNIIPFKAVLGFNAKDSFNHFHS